MVTLLNYLFFPIVLGFAYFIVRALQNKKPKQALALVLTCAVTMFFGNSLMNAYGYRNVAPDKNYGVYSNVSQNVNQQDINGFQQSPVKRPAPVIQDLTSQSASSAAIEARTKAFKEQVQWDKTIIKELAKQPVEVSK